MNIRLCSRSVNQIVFQSYFKEIMLMLNNFIYKKININCTCQQANFAYIQSIINI
jgi:hypothetical protein